MQIEFIPIGFLRTKERDIPRHWSVSDAEGEIIIDEKYTEGLKDIKKGQQIIVIFHFHKSPSFNARHLIQKPPHKEKEMGVFSTCSPIRPNPVGFSILEVTGIKGNIISVKGIDMIEGTPVLDIKPYIER
ncbi:MAG: tRNA (N6-threonylcarbamoyladenosine(37)-N6)-methyltransferase TrmO [Thermodesulfovibrionales bacterium]